MFGQRYFARWRDTGVSQISLQGAHLPDAGKESGDSPRRENLPDGDSGVVGRGWLASRGAFSRILPIALRGLLTAS